MSTPQDGFPARLASLIGQSSVRAFARRAGVSDTFLRQCLAGRTEPTRTKLIALAEAGDAEVEWLATGRQPPRHVDAPSATIDPEKLRGIIELTESVALESRISLGPAKKAQLIGVLYDMHSGAEQPLPSRDIISRLVNCAS